MFTQCEDINEKNKLLASQSEELEHLREALNNSQSGASGKEQQQPMGGSGSLKDVISKKVISNVVDGMTKESIRIAKWNRVWMQQFIKFQGNMISHCFFS